MCAAPPYIVRAAKNQHGPEARVLPPIPVARGRIESVMADPHSDQVALPAPALQKSTVRLHFWHQAGRRSPTSRTAAS